MSEACLLLFYRHYLLYSILGNYLSAHLLYNNNFQLRN